MSDLVIGLVGLPNAGASRVARAFRGTDGYEVIDARSVLETAAEQEHIDLYDRPPVSYADFEERYRSIPGNQTYLIDRAFHSPAPVSIIDSVTNVLDAVRLERSGRGVLVKVWSPFSLRHLRAVARDGDRAPATRAGFLAKEAPSYQSSRLRRPNRVAVMDMAAESIDTSSLTIPQARDRLTEIIEMQLRTREAVGASI